MSDRSCPRLREVRRQMRDGGYGANVGASAGDIGMTRPTMRRTHIDSAAAVKALVGQDLGPTAWLTMTQDRIDQFADATGDHQWLHVDPARAAKGPFGACIAHGYLTQSLSSRFLMELISYDGLRMGVNAGCDSVRFLAPVRVGARIRGYGRILSAEDLARGGVRVTIRVTIELEGRAEPACIVDAVYRLYFARLAKDAAGDGSAPLSIPADC